MRRSALLASILLSLVAPLQVCGQSPASAPAASAASSLRITSFGPATPLVVGEESIQFLGTVRNEGSARVEPNAVTVRLLALAGLDYTAGDTAPKLPELAPGESTTFRWKLQPARSDSALVASVALVNGSATPVVRISAVQQIARIPSFPETPPTPKPAAWANGSRAWVQNDRIRLRIAESNAGVPMMWLAAWTGKAWQTTGVSLPLAEVLSAEGSQQPWWEVFRAEQMTAVADAKSAALSIVGGIGIRWRATIVLTLKPGSSIAQVELRLAPLRDMRLSGARLAALQASANGNAPIEERCGAYQLAAINRSGVTTGGLWPVEPVGEDWTLAPMPPVEGAEYRTLGTEASAPAKPLALTSGAMLQFQARLFAIAESATAADAKRIVTGPPLKPPSWAKKIAEPERSHVRRGKRHRTTSHVKRTSTHRRSTRRAATHSSKRRRR